MGRISGGSGRGKATLTAVSPDLALRAPRRRSVVRQERGGQSSAVSHPGWWRVSSRLYLPTHEHTRRCGVCAEIPECYGLQPSLLAVRAGLGARGGGREVAPGAAPTAEPCHEQGEPEYFLWRRGAGCGRIHVQTFPESVC